MNILRQCHLTALHKQGHDALTPTERAQGWHFCAEHDFLLIGPGSPEMDACLCELKASNASPWEMSDDQKKEVREQMSKADFDSQYMGRWGPDDPKN